jgi:hypothetical protein
MTIFKTHRKDSSFHIDSIDLGSKVYAIYVKTTIFSMCF